MRRQTIFVIATCICSAVPAWCDAGSDLELRLNDVTAKGPRFLLNLGIQVSGSPVSLEIGVRNLGTESQIIDAFKTGNSLDVHWKNPNDKMGLLTRSTLNAGEEQMLVIRVMPTSADAVAPTVTLFSGGTVLASMATLYRLDLPQKTRKTGGEYWTYRGLEGQRMLPKAHYELCSGVAPSGYHLNADSVRVTSQTVVGGHQRTCGGWMDCTAKEVVDGNVCYTFDIQGHWKGANLSHGDENDALKVALGLEVTYVLNNQTFSLTSMQ